MNVYAQQPILPNDNDLDIINEKIRVYTDLAYQCNSFDCPVFDCESAQIVLNNLRDARKYMRYTHFWLSLYTNTQKELLFSLANEGKINSEQIEKMQFIVDMQETTRVCAGMVLDIAGGFTNVKEIFEDLTKVESMDIWEKLVDLDKLYESSKDLEQTVQIWDTKGEEPLLDIFNLDNDVINDIKSHTSDLITIIHETKISGGDIKKAFSESKSRIALYNLIGRFLIPVLENSIKKREIYIRSLINDLNETNFTQSQMFNDLGELQIKRNKVEDAFNALDGLLVIKSESLSGTLTRCFLKNKNGCPSLNYNYVSSIEIPSQYEIFDIRDIDDYKDEYNSLPIGKAMKYFTSKLLNEVPNLINNPIDISEPEKPELNISKSNFLPNERFKVQFKAPSCYPYRSWVGIVPSDISSGNEVVNNKEHTGSISFLKGKEEGELIFNAPKRAGKYNLRMNNIETGFEIASVSFEVKETSLGQLNMKAFDKKGKETQYLVSIKKGDESIKTVEGMGLTEDLPPNTYNLIFHINGEDAIERIAEVKKVETTFIEVHIKEEGKDKKDFIKYDMLPTFSTRSTSALGQTCENPVSMFTESLVIKNTLGGVANLYADSTIQVDDLLEINGVIWPNRDCGSRWTIIEAGTLLLKNIQPNEIIKIRVLDTVSTDCGYCASGSGILKLVKD
ncbi:MAG: hypothetical protein DRI75_10305 [Bacteroidetes bacterium]|nr:MAG: hypothetical protein DRI75_10305 [Bacteroidota bacterium]